jgi:DMSO reductase anchor subunit
MRPRFFNLIPLVIFTSAIVIATGLSLAEAAAGTTMGRLPAILALVVASLVASLFHLSKPLRSWRAMVGVLHSPLSREIIAVSLFCVALIAAIILPEYPVIVRLAATLGCIAIWSIALVYTMPFQVGWSGLAAFGPALGVIIIYAAAILDVESDNRIVLAIFLSVCALEIAGVYRLWRRFFGSKNWRAGLVYPGVIALIKILQFGRIIVVIAAVLILLFGVSCPVLVPTVLLVIIKRVVFYAAAVKVTPRVTTGLERDDRLQSACAAGKTGEGNR